MRRHSRTSPAAIVIVAALSVAFSGAVASGGVARAAAAKGGGTLEATVVAEPPSFDPVLMGSMTVNGQLGYAVYGALVYDDTATGKTTMGLAESVTGSTDGTVWTIKLRPDLMFSDGTPLDATALKFNFTRHGDPANRSSAFSFVSTFQAMDVIDSRTLRVTLKSPSGVFAKSLALRVPEVASPQAVQRFGKDYGTSADKIVGAGPFMVSEWLRSDHITFVRNPKYYDQPKPLLDKIVYHFVTDPATAFNTVKTGQVSYLEGYPALTDVQYSLADEDKSIGQIQTVPNTIRLIGWLHFNLKRPPFNDPRAREAFAAAIDPKAFNSALNGNLDSLATHIIAKGSAFYAKDATLPAYDRKKAQKLFNEISAQTGGPVTFTLVGLPGSRENDALQALLAGYQNVKMNLVTTTAAGISAAATKGDFDLIGEAFGGTDPDQSFYDALLSTGARNFGGYSNPAMDAALNTGRGSTKMEERVKAYAEAQRLFIKDNVGYVVPAYRTPSRYLYVKSRLGNIAAGFPIGLLVDQVTLRSTK